MKSTSLEHTRPTLRHRSPWEICRAALAVFCFAAAAVLHAAPVPGVALTLADTPAPVQKTILANIGDGKVMSIEKDEEDGQVSFTVEFTKSGQARDLKLAEDGSVLSIEVTLAETPPAVQKSIRAQLGTDKLDAIEKTFDPGETTYEVEITTKDGRESSFSIAEDGALLEMEITLSAAPAEVQKAVTAQIGTGTLTSLTKILDDAKVTFEAQFSRDGKDSSFTVGSAGNLLEVQITLEETSAEAQKTIREKVGNGRITAVFKSFEKREKVLPFKVESVKDGKPFNFSVGPKGRFLGMDD